MNHKMIIDSCYEGLIAKLTSQGKIQAISKDLISLKTNQERVLYVYDIIGSLEAFPPFNEVKKSDDLSSYYRIHGNANFQKCDDYQAWQCYNLSLLHAPKGSENYSLALANRSAVFYSMKKYKECLEDIKKVFTLKYPEKLRQKLSKRHEQCIKELDVPKVDTANAEYDEKIAKVLTLEGPRDNRYVCASAKLKIVYNEEMGRHVIANEDINVGEVLVREDPFVTLIQKSHLLFSCSFCLSHNLNLLPCQHCCFALYCSSECQKKAWKDYHATECTLMATLIDMQFTKLELLALRIVIKARNDHSSWTELFNTIKQAETSANSELCGHVKVNGNWVYDSKYYPSIHTLASNIDKRSVSDIFQKAVTAAVFLKFLEDQTDFLENDKALREEIRRTIAGTLLLHIMTCPTNMHGISTNMEDDNGHYVSDCSIASAPYAFHSLLNHCCAPNVVRSVELGTGRMTLTALRPIKKGMQLFDNYGPHHALEPIITRQHSLKFQYKFTCLCEACVNDWPTYFKLRHAFNKKKEALLGAEEIEELQKGNKEYAIMLFKPLCELAKELEVDAPCSDLADVQEALKQCLMIFYGVLPYGYSKVVDWKAFPCKVCPNAPPGTCC